MTFPLFDATTGCASLSCQNTLFSHSSGVPMQDNKGEGKAFRSVCSQGAEGAVWMGKR